MKMRHSWRWDPCVNHHDGTTEKFVHNHFGESHRQVLLIAGAGFDTRSCEVARLIAPLTVGRTYALLIQEQRPALSKEQHSRSNTNKSTLTSLFINHGIVEIAIFADDGALIGGREVVKAINKISIQKFTDIVVDCSALSIGEAFPTIRFLLSQAKSVSPEVNVHVMVTDQPTIDSAIRAVPSDSVDTIFGFKGDLGLDSSLTAARLWIPQLAHGQKTVLERILTFIKSQAKGLDVCPVLPFPAMNPRLADELVEHYQNEFENSWKISSSSIIYASENSPLDFYRSILHMEDTRSPTFREVGGSMVVITPMGGKPQSIGALMAAMERDFPVVYVESLNYDVDWGRMDSQTFSSRDIIHVWLAGEAYSASSVDE